MDRLLVNERVLTALVNQAAAELGDQVQVVNGEEPYTFNEVADGLRRCMRDLTIAVAVCEALDHQDKIVGLRQDEQHER